MKKQPLGISASPAFAWSKVQLNRLSVCLFSLHMQNHHANTTTTTTTKEGARTQARREICRSR